MAFVVPASLRRQRWTGCGRRPLRCTRPQRVPPAPLHRKATARRRRLQIVQQLDDGEDEDEEDEVGLEDVSPGFEEDPHADPTSLASSDGAAPAAADGAALSAPADWPELEPGEVVVRFVNTPSGRDVVAAARPGQTVLAVGDSVGFRIPRGCTSGLCGTCTCDMIDPASPGGHQTVRVCCTRVVVPEGMQEMVIDVYRMKESALSAGRDGVAADPMRRFENLDTEYVPAAPPRRFSRVGAPQGGVRAVVCSKCRGTGKHVCDECEGTGISPEQQIMCYVCMGMRRVRCADCQGTGTRILRR